MTPASTTETFVALRLQLDSWRWAGVPFYLRTGKRLPKRTTEIAIQFRRPPLADLQARQPDAGRAEPAHRQRAAGRGHLGAVRGEAARQPDAARAGDDELPLRQRVRRPVPEAYETLLLDAMLGDPTLFARHDFVEASWALITPIHERGATPARRTIPDLRGGRVGTARGRRDDDGATAAAGGRCERRARVAAPAAGRPSRCRSRRSRRRWRASAPGRQARRPARALTATVVVVGPPERLVAAAEALEQLGESAASARS